MPSHDQWMAWCESGARIFGTCSRRSYMAIVLSVSGRVLGSGYNGAPSGAVHCVDGGCPRGSSQVAHGSSYGNCVAVHAEANALLHSDRSAREGGTLIVNGPPCWECSKLIAGSGIKTVVYKRDHAYAEWPKCAALLQSVGIELHAISPRPSERPEPGGVLGCGGEQAVDLASRAGQPGHLDLHMPPTRVAASDALDSGDDCDYSEELVEDPHEWLEGEY